MRIVLLVSLIAAMMLRPAEAEPLSGQDVYGLLFKNGTLDDIERDTSLLYRRDVTNTLKPEAAERDTGGIALSFAEAGMEMAELEFRQEGKYRRLGRFPASVGNPMIMYFYETVVRDMAESAGGSPFYIRNRVKDALIQPAEIVTSDMTLDGRLIPAKTITIAPFAEDPNRAQMQGFGDLQMHVTMSDEVPGWYLTLVAEVPSSDGSIPVYRSALTFERLEKVQ